MSSSCNGCRILRKGCSDDCLLRQSISFIDSPQAQSHSTLFVSKFFGRSSLFFFLESAPRPLRPAVFRSLLYEACGRTINPVTGVIGLLLTGNWKLCESAVETVLQGKALMPSPELLTGILPVMSDSGETSEIDTDLSRQKRGIDEVERRASLDLDLRLMTTPTTASPRAERVKRLKSRSFESGMSETTSSESGHAKVESSEIGHAKVEEIDKTDLSLCL